MSVFSSMKPDGGNQLHPYDLSHRDVFSVKAGVLNVNLIQHTIPESQYEVNHAQITRVDPVQSAPFARMSENYEYFFVPYSQIFHEFERIYYERGDSQRNYLDGTMGTDANIAQYVPTFHYSSVMLSLAELYIRSRALLYAKSQNDIIYDEIKRRAFQSFQKYTPSTWRVPYDVHGEICIDEMLKLFDMLGYGNLYPLFSSLFDPFFDVELLPYNDVVRTDEITAYNNDYHRRLEEHFGFDSTTSEWLNYSAVASHFYDTFKLTTDEEDKVIPSYMANNRTAIQRIDDISGELVSFFCSANYPLFWSRYQDLDSYYPNVLALASYVKVFSDIYRNTQYDNDNYANLFNFDYATDPETTVIVSNKILMMLVPRFRQYKKDIFTGTFPNAQFGSVAVSSLQNPSSIYVSSNPSSYSSAFVKAGVSNGRLFVGASNAESGSNNAFTIDSGVSALAIRQALSLQRYKERILRAGNRLTALQNAVFGDKSRFIEDSYVQFIGANKNNIDFNSVAATSDAGASEVGQLSANGVGTRFGSAFKYHSHDFGILIGIYYVLPESEYESYMLDPQNTKSETNDYYKPDFMNLGLSPVWNYDYNFLSHDVQVGDKVLGYLANYWEYKTNIDKVHGNFYASLPLTSQSYGISETLPDLPTAFARLRGQNANYVTPRSAVDMVDGLTLGVLYVNPHDIDSIFYANSDFTINTDQFKVNCNHDIKALLPMSVVGLPEY